MDHGEETLAFEFSGSQLLQGRVKIDQVAEGKTRCARWLHAMARKKLRLLRDPGQEGFGRRQVVADR